MSERMYYSHEAEVRANRQRVVLAMVVAGLGIGLGAALALLFAPQSGDKTRALIGDQVDHMVSQGQNTSNHLAKEVRTQASKARNNLEKRLQDLNN